ncbi:MAG TPA: FAD-dependent oxidoreductase [Vicinamibacterales bacterium]|nr:FAD-dependent oxidoreductase [Vicinamibacterales bacterium]
MTRYGRSPWLDNFPISRIPSYPRHRGAAQADAVVIGGGLTGCATAWAFAAAGVNVILLEADRIGRGATAFSTGWISEEPGVAFADLENALGLRAARRAFQSWRRAALDFASLLRRLEIKCALEEHGAITIATGPDQTLRMKKDHKARAGAGLATPLLNARAIRSDVNVDAAAGLRSKAGATIDPYRATLGLAAAAADRGAVVCERTPVRRITFGRKNAQVFTATGSIRTQRIIVATGVPTVALFKSLRRHFWFRTTFVAMTDPVPAKIRKAIGGGRSAEASRSVLRDTADPPHVVRWLDADRLLVSGADGDTPPPRKLDKILVQRTGQLMYELSTMYPDISGIQAAYGWAADYARTAEGIPYIGAHRNYPHHLFVFGDSSRSLTGAYLASRILLRHHSGELDPADEVFGFHR